MIGGAKIKIIDLNDGSVVLANTTMNNIDSTGSNWTVYTYTFSLSSFTAGHRYMAIVTAIDADGFDDWEFGMVDERTVQFYVVS